MVTVWGTTFVSSKVLLNAGLQPADIFFVRFIIAYFCMIVISHRRLWSDNIRDELTLLGLGVMGGSLYFLTENMALVYSTSANVSILVSTTPLLTAMIVSACYRSERMTRTQIFGSVIAFIGAALVVLNGQVMLHCMFGDPDIEDWKVDMVFTKKATETRVIHGVEVQIARQQPSLRAEYWYYAIFKYDGVVYDLRTLSDDAGYVDEVLERMLGELS